MLSLLDLAAAVAGYLLGSIPSGLIIVKLLSGKDIRSVESGRTGGTNAMRAAGLLAGLLTALFDILKGAAAVWLAQAMPAGEAGQILAALGAILGHNYSIFLIERDAGGRLRLRGGAGGAPCVGGALGLWAPSFLIIIPVGVAVFFGIGYASVTTMSVALTATIIFAVRAALGYSPWSYVIYGIVAELLLVWALLPNIKRLMAGSERGVSWRAKRQQPPAQDGGSSLQDMD